MPLISYEIWIFYHCYHRKRGIDFGGAQQVYIKYRKWGERGREREG